MIIFVGLSSLPERVFQMLHEIANGADFFFILLVAAMFFFAAFSLLLPIITIAVHAIREIYVLKKNKKEKDYEQLVYHYLSNSPLNENTFGYTHHRINRKILLNIIYEIYRYVKGEERDSLRKLYKYYGLDQYILQKLKSPVTIHQSFYLKIYSVISPPSESYPIIEKKAKSKFKEHRLYAMQILILQDPEQILDLFSAYQYYLSLWEQISYYDFFISRSIKVPDFHALALNKNVSISLFGIRMVRLFGQKKGSVKGYESLLVHPNLEIQIEVFKGLAEFGYTNLKELQQEFIPRLSPYLRMQAMTFLAKTKNASPSLLMQYYSETESFTFRLHLLYCIYNFIKHGHKMVEAFTRQSENKALQNLSIHLINNVL